MKFWAKTIAITFVALWIFDVAIFMPYEVKSYQRELSKITADWLYRKETEMLSPNELAHGKLKWIKVKPSKKEAYRRYKKRLQELHKKYSFLFK